MPMSAEEPIRRETQLFAWMILLSGLSYPAYCDLAPERQLAYGLDPGGPAIALEQVTTAYRAKLEQLKQIDEAQRRGAN
jgi:hypothetical protein